MPDPRHEGRAGEIGIDEIQPQEQTRPDIHRLQQIHLGLRQHPVKQRAGPPPLDDRRHDLHPWQDLAIAAPPLHLRMRPGQRPGLKLQHGMIDDDELVPVQPGTDGRMQRIELATRQQHGEQQAHQSEGDRAIHQHPRPLPVRLHRVDGNCETDGDRIAQRHGIRQDTADELRIQLGIHQLHPRPGLRLHHRAQQALQNLRAIQPDADPRRILPFRHDVGLADLVQKQDHRITRRPGLGGTRQPDRPPPVTADLDDAEPAGGIARILPVRQRHRADTGIDIRADQLPIRTDYGNAENGAGADHEFGELARGRPAALDHTGRFKTGQPQFGQRDLPVDLGGPCVGDQGQIPTQRGIDAIDHQPIAQGDRHDDSNQSQPRQKPF